MKLTYEKKLRIKFWILENLSMCRNQNIQLQVTAIYQSLTPVNSGPFLFQF